MGIKLMESIYNVNKQLVHLRIRLLHERYGCVICVFHVKRRGEEKVILSNAHAENKVIPLEEHKTLLTELKTNTALLVEIEKMGDEIMEKEPVVAEEKRLEKVGTLSELTLDYLVVLSASSTYSKEIKRIGSKLGEITENEFEKHTMFVMVKFKELSNEYELKITYQTNKGYKIKPTSNNRDKTKIAEYLDEMTVKGIMKLVKQKLEFLPEFN